MEHHITTTSQSIYRRCNGPQNTSLMPLAKLLTNLPLEDLERRVPTEGPSNGGWEFVWDNTVSVVKSLPLKPQGKPVLLGVELDMAVQHCVQELWTQQLSWQLLWVSARDPTRLTSHRQPFPCAHWAVGSAPCRWHNGTYRQWWQAKYLGHTCSYNDRWMPSTSIDLQG